MLALDPQETFRVSLSSDATRDESDRPAFEFRYLTAREFLKVAKVGDDLDGRNDLAEEVMQEVCDALSVNLVGWRNVRDRAGNLIGFGGAKLIDMLTIGEVWELYYSARRYSRLTPEDKKKSESESPTSSDGSAPDGAANAQTGQADSSPQSSSAPNATAPAAPNAATGEP